MVIIHCFLDVSLQGRGGVTILIVYVDDIIITGNHSDEAKQLEDHLTQHFEVKNLGTLKYFLA